MHKDHNRREFLATTACAVTGATIGLSANSPARETTRMKKAVIIGKPTEENLKPLKALGFDGVETNAVVAPDEAAESKRAADKMGMTIHCVLRGWMNFNSDKSEDVKKSIDAAAAALRAGQAYGADAILLVPCRIGGMPMPEAWEFHVRFDKKTGHLTSVSVDDDGRYEDYIAAQDKAYDRSLEAIGELIPLAQKTGVVIAVENVWNNLWVDPRHFTHFIDSFDSPWVQAYFDIGNHVKYSPPEWWIGILGKRLAKIHVKDFKLNDNLQGGRFVDIRDGSVKWPTVHRALTEVGYDGWLTLEGGPGSREEAAKRMDLILDGK